GPPPASESYLRADNIMESCETFEADAVHPGYGFLSENPEFVRRVEEKGVTFIGPTAEAMETMGNKLTAKDSVRQYHVPMVPGSGKPLDRAEDAAKVAVQVGFPVLIKAAAGGGGKGMRVVDSPGNISEQAAAAMREAESAFGDASVFIERYVAGPRHVEIQLLADKFGNIVHLFERECSIQRRHQKVIEEAPSSVLSPKLREQMGQCAIDVARACGYVGAGTVEFLLDENNSFYFLEMNTRLQVEHPVTEMITGIDIVKEQINIARGGKLPFNQEDIAMRGHAIEARVYAEDPAGNFLPDTGTLSAYHLPRGPGIRVDDGYELGMEVSIHYDPMIAKLIAYAGDRQSAIQRLVRAIDEYRITGVKTTLPFCRFAILHDAFRSGHFNTHFVQKYFKPELLEDRLDDDALEVAAVVAALRMQGHIERPAASKENAVSEWKRNRTAIGE
ncbi:MAG: acetyl/propionyl/methylcrotonyl-CoA carboxylase subunit alpha, partial [Flavobacteriales bacterium]